MLASVSQVSSTSSIAQAPTALVVSNSSKVGNKKFLICTHCNKIRHARETLNKDMPLQQFDVKMAFLY